MFVRSLSLTLVLLGCASAPKPASTATSEDSTSAPSAALEPAPSLVESSDSSRSRVEARPPQNEAATSTVSEREPAPKPAEYATPLLDEVSLAQAARTACEVSRQSGRPLLIEFSAPWCEDCVALERMKAAVPLASEIADWQLFAINIGGGFEHPALMRAYRVKAIARLVSVLPKSCAEPLTIWQQGNARTLDGLGKGKSKNEGAVSEELARWLKTERERLARASGAP